MFISDPTRTLLIELVDFGPPIIKSTMPIPMKKHTLLHLLKNRFKTMLSEKVVVKNSFETIKGKYRERLKELTDENIRLKYELRKLKNQTL